VKPADGVQRRGGAGGVSYLGKSERVLHFGLGRNQRAEVVTIEWGPKAQQTLYRVPVNQHLVVRPDEARRALPQRKRGVMRR